MPVTAISAEELNRQNQEFWSDQQALLERRVADPAIRETAFEAMNAEQKKRVPIYYQTSIYAALAASEGANQRCLSQQARKGGWAEKADQLQRLIEELVTHNPSLTLRQLKDKLRADQGIAPIQDIDDEVVFFTNFDERTKTAPFSGLKHRLTRARKTARKLIRSR
jgi:uncharacterized protein YihD (DUF1040 family)